MWSTPTLAAVHGESLRYTGLARGHVGSGERPPQKGGGRPPSGDGGRAWVLGHLKRDRWGDPSPTLATNRPPPQKAGWWMAVCLGAKGKSKPGVAANGEWAEAGRLCM